MRLTFRESIGSLLFRRYQHARHGVVETLTQQSVVFVRPVFGLLKPDEQQPPEVAEFRTQKPKPKRSRGLGGRWKAKRSAGGDG
jgi:hypothetical protein